jgi:hypothetical protein
MVILLLILSLMLISTVLVIAAGMLSSRLSRDERWVEAYEETKIVSPDAEPASTK